MSCHVMSYHIISYSCHVMSCHVISYHIILISFSHLISSDLMGICRARRDHQDQGVNPAPGVIREQRGQELDSLDPLGLLVRRGLTEALGGPGNLAPLAQGAPYNELNQVSKHKTFYHKITLRLGVEKFVFRKVILICNLPDFLQDRAYKTS